MAGGVNIPSGFGGLVSYKEEYKSIFNIKPIHVVVFVILILLFRIGLEFFIK